MDAAGATWAWAILSLVSLVGLALALVKPCRQPPLDGHARSTGRGLASTGSARGAQFSPIGSEGDPQAADHDEDVESAHDASSHGVAPEQDADSSAASWSRHNLLHQYRTFVGIVAVQSALLLLGTIALGVNAWESILIPSPVDPASGRSIEIVLGLVSREVTGAPVTADPEPRWRSGHYSDICSGGSNLTGCAFAVQATGVVVLLHALIGILAMASVLAYLLMARHFPFVLAFGAWAWRVCLLQAISTLAAPLLWATIVHTYEGERNAAAALDSSFFLALLCGVANAPFLYCLRLALVAVDSSDSIHWRQLSLLENEAVGAAQESMANGGTASPSGRGSTAVHPSDGVGFSSTASTATATATAPERLGRPRSESEEKEDREYGREGRGGGARAMAGDELGVDLDPSEMKRPRTPAAIALERSTALMEADTAL